MKKMIILATLPFLMMFLVACTFGNPSANDNGTFVEATQQQPQKGVDSITENTAVLDVINHPSFAGF